VKYFSGTLCPTAENAFHNMKLSEKEARHFFPFFENAFRILKSNR
jgi:hypothetical protein